MVPAHPAAADYLARLTGWQMLGNDQYGDCCGPDTRILTADLRWVRAGDLVPGDKLLGFDEESRPSLQESAKRVGRFFVPSLVETADIIKRPCYELEFDDGTVVCCSSGHRWLVSKGGVVGCHTWAQTSNLVPGASKVIKPLSVWDAEDSSYETGYLAAAYDGEGTLHQSRTSAGLFRTSLEFTQAANAMLLEVERCLKVLGFEHKSYVYPNRRRDGQARQDSHRLVIAKNSDCLRLLGSVRPVRLLENLDLGRLARINGDVVKLVRKDFIGEQDVVYLNTTSRTYFAEGLASHNCVAVTWANTRRLVTSYLSSENYPPLDQVLAFYKTQNPGFPAEDNGMDIQVGLQYLVSSGGPDGVKALGFARVDYTNADEVKAAIAVFGSVWTGINVQQAQQAQFGAGQPWDWVAGSPLDGASTGKSVTSDVAVSVC